MNTNVTDAQPPARSRIDDVARHAGVSTATVSRCLNAPQRVRKDTRIRIEAAVAALGYTPHFGARALASDRTGTMGVVIPTMENAIFARGVQEMEDTLSANGVTLLVATSRYDPTREAQQVRALLGRGVDGIALIGASRPGDLYPLMQARRTPYVHVWTYDEHSDHPCIGFDNRRAAMAMARHVLSFGHRRVAMISGLTEGNDRATSRLAGVRSVLDEAGGGLAPDRVIEAPYTLDDGEAAARVLLALSPRPTAILCGNDVLAVGALRAARRAGLSVPGDVSVVGFDDIDLAVAVDPALTTTRVPHRRMGRATAQYLLASARGETPARLTVFETQLIHRESLGPAPPGG